MATKVSFNPFTGKLDQTTTSSGGGSPQTLNLTGDTLAISDGNSVDLSGYVDEATIQNITVIQNLTDGSGWNLPGPYTNEAGAAAAGVSIGQAYYDNGGTVRVRQT